MIVPEDQDPLLNTVLGGARIQRRVSAGLLANVYLGHYERLNVPVAVKVLSPKATAQGMNKERFVREGRALAQLSHPNIIKIYNVGHDNGRYFIVMDWIQDGMNLRQLAQSRPLTPVQSLKVARRLAEALEYIHQKGLIHRDIKPANVCLRKGGVPVLMDFSLIKDTSSDVQLTAPGTIMGTVNFMPPEQAQPGGPFGNVGPWSDVYSVAGTLYWLLTGRPPFKGRTPMETIIKLIREPHVPPSQINPSVPAEVDALIAQALAKKSDERYQSAQIFIQAVDQVAQQCAEALSQGTPPPPATDDDAGIVPAPAPAPPPAPARPWGGASSGTSPIRPPSSGVMPAIANPPLGVPLSQPQPAGAPMSAGVAAQAGAPRGTARLGTPGAPITTSFRSSSGRMQTASGSGDARLPQPGSFAGAPPTAAPAPETWQPANGLDVPPDMEATVRLRNPPPGIMPPPPPSRASGLMPAARPSAIMPLPLPPLQPPASLPPVAGSTPPAMPRSSSSDRVLARPAPPPPAAPAPPPPPAPSKKEDLNRSWVEDAPSAPSWTDQPKDPLTSILGMRAPVIPQTEPQPEAPAPPPPTLETPPSDEVQLPPVRGEEPPRLKTVSERLHRAPKLSARRKRATLEIALVVVAILVIVLCIGVGSYVIFKGGP